MRLILFGFLLISCVPSIAGQSDTTRRLLERNKMFEPRIIQIADNVYTAIGYQVSTNSMIIGKDGLIIIDPGQVPQAALKVREEFRKITDKPVKAIIYTHGHSDHTNGAISFYDRDQDIQVWARANFDSEARHNQHRGLSGGVRPVDAQGFSLLPEQKISVGIAIPPDRRPTNSMMVDGTQQGLTASRQPELVKILPNHTFSEDRISINIAGITIELVAAPGETDDQLYVWLPEEKVIFSGDNFYQSWPNTYPLRGTARRSVRDWISSLGKMIEEAPRHLVGGHTSPITGDAIEVLTNYRDALQWVYTRTVEGANLSLGPDELVEYARLPVRYAGLDYLADYYGSVEGTIRDIYAQELGWFDGNPLNLHRETPLRQAQRTAELAGGETALSEKAHSLLETGDSLGAAQLAAALIRLQPENPIPLRLMANALAIIGEQTFNAPARNYTLAYSNLLRNKAKALKQE